MGRKKMLSEKYVGDGSRFGSFHVHIFTSEKRVVKTEIYACQ